MGKHPLLKGALTEEDFRTHCPNMAASVPDIDTFIRLVCMMLQDPRTSNMAIFLLNRFPTEYEDDSLLPKDCILKVESESVLNELRKSSREEMPDVFRRASRKPNVAGIRVEAALEAMATRRFVLSETPAYLGDNLGAECEIPEGHETIIHCGIKITPALVNNKELVLCRPPVTKDLELELKARFFEAVSEDNGRVLYAKTDTYIEQLKPAKITDDWN